VDSLSLHLSGEFVESNLGTAREADGSITVRMIAQQYLFVPHCILVPPAFPFVCGLRVRTQCTVSASAIPTMR
jgi:hypothetical protein